jgi:FKBP-type peptidyl-prolyl cis-trans isomerase SlyD
MARRVISFHYTLTDTAGALIDSSRQGEAFSFLEGAQQIIYGLERELARLQKGQKKRIEVPAAQAYGPRDENMKLSVPKSKLPAQEVKPGDRFRGGPDAQAPVFVVVEVNAEEVVLDGNHPLAGQDLVFDVELLDIRDATPEELTHGHAHGAHGHSH